jgi:hypothetical protein
MMKKLAGLLPILFTLHAAAQQTKLTAAHWDFLPNTVEFLTYKGVPAMKILTRDGRPVLKDMDFTDGTIEYDMEPTVGGFTAMYFRWSSQQESECFYFRTGCAGNSNAPDAVQYAPILKGVNLWDMLPEYQSSATFERGQWNHVKLVVSGKQMLVYVNDKTALQIPRLEADSQHGKIAFDGGVIVSNLVIRPGQTERLSPVPGIDLSDNDARYLRKWEIGKVSKVRGEMPPKDSVWDTIIAERRGLINLTRLYGESKEKRVVWLKTTIHSKTAQIRTLNLGFSDDVEVLINGKYLYVDKNQYGAPISKMPDGRCSLENATLNVPLNEGDNELLIALSNYFYGWGIMARFDKMDGLDIEK